MHVSVDPAENQRAMAMHRRLGYVPMHDAPYQKTATFYDEAGNAAEVTYWNIDLVKRLARTDTA